MKKLLIMTVLAFSLTACGDNYTVEELVEDEDLRMKVLQECEKIAPEKLAHEEKCVMAMEAQGQAIAGGILKGLMGQ